MPIQFCSNYQFNAPENAAGVSVTPSGSSGGDSAWVEVFVADADCVLTGVVLFDPAVAATFRLDVGIDTGGGDTLITSTAGSVAFDDTIGWGHIPFRVPIDAIPNGASVRVRMAKTGTSTAVWKWALLYFKKPISGTILTTANPQLVSPLFPMPTITSATVAWDNSAWATIFTPSEDSVITGYIHNFVANSEDYIFDFGQSSTPIWTVKERQHLSDFTLYRHIKHPFTVAGGTALQGRWRKVGTTLRALPVAVTYIELPL